MWLRPCREEKSVAKAKAKGGNRRQMVWCLKDEVPYSDGNGGAVFEKKEKKIKCGCGGSYLPCGTAAGARSWRTHHSSDRHMRWDPLFN